MIYLTKEELVKNITEQTERAAAVIEHTDFNSDELNPNMIIIPFLSNIIDSALIVTALEEYADSGQDCHRNALRLVMSSGKTKTSAKNFIRQIQELREKYTLSGTSLPFDSGECLDFLNAYDCLMFDFIKNSPTVKAAGNLKFSSFRNAVEKLLKKNKSAESAGSSENALLEQLLAENRRINEKLDRIIKLLSDGGIK